MYPENWPLSQRLYTSSFNPGIIKQTNKKETLINERKAIVWNVLNVIWILWKNKRTLKKKKMKEKKLYPEILGFFCQGKKKKTDSLKHDRKTYMLKKKNKKKKHWLMDKK